MLVAFPLGRGVVIEREIVHRRLDIHSRRGTGENRIISRTQCRCPRRTGFDAFHDLFLRARASGLEG